MTTTGAAPIHDRGQLDALVLASLSETDLDGFEVLEVLSRRLGRRRGVSTNRVFSVLHRLARNRLLGRSPSDPRRYRLTEVGRRSLAARTEAADSYAEALHGLQP